MADKQKSKSSTKQSQEPFGLFDLPRELRDKIYDFAINVNEALNIASLVRVNHQVHNEAYQIMLKKYTFVLAKLPVRPSDDRPGLISSMSIDYCDATAVPGVIADTEHSGMRRLTTFPCFDMQILATAPLEEYPTITFMLIGRAALESFAFVVSEVVSGPDSLKHDIDMRKLTWQINVSDEPRCTLERATSLLQPFREHWWGFEDVSISSGNHTALAHKAQGEIKGYRWQTLDHFVQALKQRYSAGIQQWTRGEHVASINTMKEIELLLTRTAGTRIFQSEWSRQENCARVCMVFSMANLLARIGNAWEYADFTTTPVRHMLDCCIGGINEVTPTCRELCSLTYIYEAHYQVGVGDWCAADEAYNNAEAWARSDDWFESTLNAVEDRKYRLYITEGMLDGPD